MTNFIVQRGCVTAVQFILFNFANYSPSIAMELVKKLHLNDKIRDPGQWFTKESWCHYKGRLKRLHLINNNSAILRMTIESCMLLTKELKVSECVYWRDVTTKVAWCILYTPPTYEGCMYQLTRTEKSFSSLMSSLYPPKLIWAVNDKLLPDSFFFLGFGSSHFAVA